MMHYGLLMYRDLYVLYANTRSRKHIFPFSFVSIASGDPHYSIHPPPPSSSSVKLPSSPMTYRLPACPFSAVSPPPIIRPSANSGACRPRADGIGAASAGSGRRGNDQPLDAGGTTSGKRRVHREL